MTKNNLAVNAFKYIDKLVINEVNVKKIANELDFYLLHSDKAKNYKELKNNRISFSKDVLKYLGVNVEFKSFDNKDINSFIVFDDNKRIFSIVANNTMDNKHLNYYLACDLGNIIYNFNNSSIIMYNNEQQNYINIRNYKFASNFLMPEKNFILNYIVCRKNINYLSEKYNVPVDRVKIRIRELGLA